MNNHTSNTEKISTLKNSEEARKYLEYLLWQDSPHCPGCGEGGRIQIRKIQGYYRCLACQSDFTVRSGTIFERSHISLDKWLTALFVIARNHQKISSTFLAKHLHITQKSAWNMLKKLEKHTIIPNKPSAKCGKDCPCKSPFQWINRAISQKAVCKKTLPVKELK